MPNHLIDLKYSKLSQNFYIMIKVYKFLERFRKVKDCCGNFYYVHNSFSRSKNAFKTDSFTCATDKGKS